MDANKCPPHKHTECRTYKAKDKPLFLIPNPHDAKDFYCKEHKAEEMERRAKL